MRHLEAFCDDALAFLKAGLPARIAEVNAATTDFDLAVPRNPEGYYFGGPPSLTVWEYPSIEVAAPDITMMNPSLGQLSWDTQPRVMIRIFVQHTHFETLTRMAYRYGRCILETMVQPDAFGPHEKVRSVSTHYGVNPETNERDEFTGGALTVWTLDSMEVRP